VDFLNKMPGKRGINNFDVTYRDIPQEWKRNALR